MVSNLRAFDNIDTHLGLVDAVKSWESLFSEMKTTAGLVGGTVAVHVHVTGNAGDEERRLDTSSVEKDASEGEANTSTETISLARGRPDIPSIIAEKERAWSGHVGVAGKVFNPLISLHIHSVAVCGPLSFMTDASNAVSNVQLGILRGRASCAEMYLRSEAFGW